ncbi:MAG: hypothetical protein IT443_05190 [Phycisphaeraceae bacterium]|nr:hypothetical protein [Phycisphaeraceae bacterium]
MNAKMARQEKFAGPGERVAGAGRVGGIALIEILVVVGIIAVLISLLLVVLSMSRAAVRSSVCATQLRELYTANMAYAADHDQRFVPGAADMDPGANLQRWHGTRTKTNRPFDSARGPLAGYLGREGAIKQCPAFVTPNWKPDEKVSKASTYFEAGCGGYGYNNRYVGTEDRKNKITAIGARTDAFAAPQETVMFADAGMARRIGGAAEVIEYSFVEPPVGDEGLVPFPSVHFRHHGHANVAWLDGHTDGRTLNYSGASYESITPEENRELGVGGFGPGDNNSLFDRE